MTSYNAEIIDKICQRYPNTRPSQILGLDPFTGHQLDSAMALRFDLKDKDFILNIVEQIVSQLDNVMRANGAKVKKRKKRKNFIPDYPKHKDKVEEDYVPTVDELLSIHGGAGTIITNG